MIESRWLEQRCGVSFLECVEACLYTREFVSEWERLWGKKLLATNQLDRATGYDVQVMREFSDFVYTAVFIRLS